MNFTAGIEQDSLGMTVTSSCVTLEKDESNLIGISIGGGAPSCPCLYIVQVFDNTPASRNGRLESGDEIVAINNELVTGRTKLEAAKSIQNAKGSVKINFNKLHLNTRDGKTFDILLKKLKHQMVENMTSTTADSLGLSRAILCNDSLIKKLEELERTEITYTGLVEHTRRVLRGYFDVLLICRSFGDVFCSIGTRENKMSSRAFGNFGEYHQQIERYGIKMLKKTKPILQDLGTYLQKAIPDTKTTIKKYADVKFEYLSYCLKIKELDDEEVSYASIGEPLYRVETGNYEYRLILRCRAISRRKFADLRSDVLVKLELLDNKRVQDIVFQLKRLLINLTSFHYECKTLIPQANLFPIEVDIQATEHQDTDLQTTGIDAFVEEEATLDKEEQPVELLTLE